MDGETPHSPRSHVACVYYWLGEQGAIVQILDVHLGRRLGIGHFTLIVRASKVGSPWTSQ